MPPGQYRGCGRGVFALSSWKVPLRRPEKLKEVKTEVNDWLPGQKLMMKYKYEANAESPLGKELTVKQKDLVQFVSRFDNHWIAVTNEAGDQGYIPSSYVMADPTSVKSLPWLDNKPAQENVQQSPAEYKPYRSAYGSKKEESGGDSGSENAQYYCKVCDKQLNGPIPYQAHINSKAHKDEVEVQSAY